MEHLVKALNKADQDLTLKEERAKGLIELINAVF